MALKPLSIWGAGALLATTLACSNKDATDETSSYVPPSTSNPAAGGVSGKTTTTTKGGAKNTTSKAQQQGGESSEGGSDNGGADNGGADASGGTTKKTTTKGSSSSTKATGGSSSKTSSGTKTAGGSSSVGGTGGKGGTTTKATTTVVDTGDRPPGYFKTSDWGVSSADWKGCVWTGIDTVASTTTTITPKDFTEVKNGGPYQVSGKVNKAYEAVALLGFNIGEAASGDAEQCKYVAGKATEDGPPSAPMATVTASSKGLAINWTAKTKPGQFRVQLQEPDCASNLGHCYCATITDATGPSFVAWSDFYAYCWNYPERTDTSNPAAVQYDGQDIDAVVFSVPGNGTADTAFDFTVTGFAPGDSAEDAPGEAAGCGEQTGKLGDVTNASEDASMQRQVVTDANCKKYVVFNNNWGNPSGSIQTISYTGNSFTVEKSTGSGSGAPASFPCFYVGASGDLGGGTFNTWEDTGLPKQISAISSAKTTFTYSGKTSGNFNASYDVWFSKNQPTAGGYEDAISGFLMVWFYKPSGQTPIGSIKRTASIAGKTWDVWVGPRGNTKPGTDEAGRPVVSYVAQSPITNMTFDLKEFMADAVKNGDADKTAGGTSQAFANSWYLTDVFAGFEAWTGSDIVGIKETFSIEIK